MLLLVGGCISLATPIVRSFASKLSVADCSNPRKLLAVACLHLQPVWKGGGLASAPDVVGRRKPDVDNLVHFLAALRWTILIVVLGSLLNIILLISLLRLPLSMTKVYRIVIFAVIQLVLLTLIKELFIPIISLVLMTSTMSSRINTMSVDLSLDQRLMGFIKVCSGVMELDVTVLLCLSRNYSLFSSSWSNIIAVIRVHAYFLIFLRINL